MAEPPEGYDVLIVDDDRDIRDTFASILEEDGFSVRTASDGLDALEKLSLALPHLILLDLMMPRMSGWGFRATQLRATQLRDPRLAAIPVVVITASANLATTAEQFPGVALLAKPVHLERLVTTVRQHCGHTDR
jgi:two-component system, chemotaxis family, chemotaxis protein CheY